MYNQLVFVLINQKNYNFQGSSLKFFLLDDKSVSLNQALDLG